MLLDVALPDGTGFDLCREIKAKDLAPVIFLTARDEERDVVLGFDLGSGRLCDQAPSGTGSCLPNRQCRAAAGKHGSSPTGTSASTWRRERFTGARRRSL